MAKARDDTGLRRARRRGGVWGFVVGLFAFPFVLIALLVTGRHDGEFTLLVVREANAPAGSIAATIDGWPLTPRLAGEAGIEFHPERRNRRTATLVLRVEGRPELRLETILRHRDDSCPIVARLSERGFAASECLWRPAYRN